MVDMSLLLEDYESVIKLDKRYYPSANCLANSSSLSSCCVFHSNKRRSSSSYSAAILLAICSSDSILKILFNYYLFNHIAVTRGLRNEIS